MTPLAITGNVANPHWYWLIVFYFFLGGIAAGAYLIAATVDLFTGPENRPVSRAGYLIGAPLAALCGLLLTFDLGQPLRFWHMLVNVTTNQPAFKYWSPMSYGSWILTGFGICSGLSFLLVLLEWRGTTTGLIGKIVAAIGAIFALLLVSYTGVLLNATNQHVWGDNTLLGALFAASGVSTGIATIALTLILWRRGRNLLILERLERADLVAIAVEIVILLALIFVLASVGAARPLIGGSIGIALWVGVVGFGLLIPLILYLRPRLLGWLTPAVAASLALIGGFILRAVILFSAQA